MTIMGKIKTIEGRSQGYPDDYLKSHQAQVISHEYSGCDLPS